MDRLLPRVVLLVGLSLPTVTWAELPPVRARDEGTQLSGVVFDIDCVGAGIACTKASATRLTVTVGGGGSGDSITVGGVAATDPDFIAGDITWTLDTAATPDTIAGTIADSVTVTGWVLGTSSATQLTSPTVVIDLLDASGAVDMDYGSADVTDHTFTSDGGTVILDGTGTFSGLVTANANLTIGNGATTAGVLTLLEDTDAGSNFASFQVPALAANTVYTLPADDGDADQVLSTNGSGTLDWVAAGAGDVTDVFSCASGDCASIAAADGDLLDFALVNNSGTAEGLILPQGTAPTGGTAEGQIAWETDVDELLVGTGAAQVRVGSYMVYGAEVTSRTATFAMRFGGVVGATDPEIPMDTTFSKLYCNVETAPGVGNSWTITLQEDGVDTAVTCAISGTGVSCSDLTNSDAMQEGDTPRWNWVEGGTATGTGGQVCVMQAYPDE